MVNRGGRDVLNVDVLLAQENGTGENGQYKGMTIFTPNCNPMISSIQWLIPVAVLLTIALLWQSILIDAFICGK